MPEFTAQDVKRLRDATGAGMMDAKRALTENDGEFEAAGKWLREKGLGKAAERSDRDNVEGAIAVARSGNAAAIVQLKCETDFVAKQEQFVALVNELAQLVAANGEAGVNEKKEQIDDLKITLKENIELGQVVRVEADPANSVDTYLHVQSGRGVNGIIVELANGSDELAHDVAVTAAFTKPRWVKREDVPAEVLESERAAFLNEVKNQGKPEAAWDKIVEGKLAGFLKEYPGGVLLEQPFFAKDEKQTVKQALGGAEIVTFIQVMLG
ncbi:MAG: elongation factor Ts, partial [Acidimicrobiaceae bacterium]|nr:elongation factor Ts [Acidimicrobiaceae bacterium]